jgi:site-specific recombinase XerD
VFGWLPEVTAWIARYVQRESPAKDFKFHRLRHTFGCRFIERGGRLEALQHILGHASITQTEGYAKLSSAAVAAEMARVDVAAHVATASEPEAAGPAEALTR